MRRVTRVLAVKARLLASTMPEQVAAIAATVSDLQDPLSVAALCLAAFDGDAAYCDYVLRKVQADDPPWVRQTFQHRWNNGGALDMPSLIVDRMIYLSKTRHQARGAR